MSQRAYSHLPDGTLALIREFLQNYTNEEKACETFNEIVGLSKINADEVKNLAIDEFRKEIQQLATKNELVAVKEALQAQIDGVRGEMKGVKNELQVQILATKDDIVATKEALQSQIDGVRNELQSQILATKAELRTEIADLRAESKAEMANLRADNVSLKAELKSFKKEMRIIAIILALIMLIFQPTTFAIIAKIFNF